MEQNNKKYISCRGIILRRENLLVAKHSLKHDFYALPGGRIKENENPKECVEREIFEEFGIAPKLGRLLYISQFTENEMDFLEFFFEIKNGQDYLDIEKLNGTHRHELVDIKWISRDDDVKVLPEKFFNDFKNGTIFNDEVKFIKD